MTGAVSLAEKFVWTMIIVILAMIVAFAITGWLENTGNGNWLGNFAQWVNDHARPQAS